MEGVWEDGEVWGWNYVRVVFVMRSDDVGFLRSKGELCKENLGEGVWFVGW